MILRKTKTTDIPRVMEIINQAKQYFKENDIDQWQDGYPNNMTIQEDIKNGEAYVLDHDDHILGTCMITINGEPTYDVIEGKWFSEDDYICVHRIAIDNQYKGTGLASIILNEAVALYPQYHSLRMDTHEDNLSMQRFLSKYGFHYCGMITLASGALRKAYEKINHNH